MDKQIPRLIAGLFADEGQAVLAESGLGDNWHDALAELPADVLVLSEDSRAKGAGALVKARDFYSKTGQLRPAIAFTRGLLRVKMARLGDEHPDTIVELAMLGILARRAGKTEAAQEFLHKAWSTLRSVTNGRDIRLAIAAAAYGDLCLANGDLVQAERLYRQAYGIRKDVARPTIGMVSGKLAEILVRKGEVKEAIPLMWESYQKEKRRLGKDHAQVLARAQVLTRVLISARRFDSAAPLLRDLHNRAKLSGNEDEIAHTAFELGIALDSIGRKEEGFRLMEEAVRWTRRAGTVTDPHEELPTRLTTFSRMVFERRRQEEAEGMLREALEAERRLFGDGSPEVAMRYTSLGQLCVQTGRFDEAIGWLDTSASLLVSSLGGSDPRTQRTTELLVKTLIERSVTLRKQGDRQMSRAMSDRAESFGGQVLRFDHPLMVELRRIQ